MYEHRGIIISDPTHFAQLDKSALIPFMGEIRYIIIAKQCEVAGTSSILDGCSLQPNTVLLYLFPPRFVFLIPLALYHPARIRVGISPISP